VAEFFIEMLAAVLVIFLWLIVVALLVRPFGMLPLSPFSFFKRRYAFQALTLSQHVLVVGVLLFGCGMLMVRTSSDYLEWKYFHGSSASLTTTGLLRAFVTYPLIAGVLYGLISWNARSGKSTK
jgi:DUF1365 family protein